MSTDPKSPTASRPPIPLLGSAQAALILIVLLAPAAGVAADGTEAAGGPVVARGAVELYVQGGLTADDAARRAEATSFEVEARHADLAAAAAAVDQALLGYIPRLSGTARYVRLSSIEVPVVGNLVTAPSVSGAGPIPPGTALVNVPLSFPVILNQTTLQASLSLPISDYILRVPKAYASASRSQSAAELTERATRKKVASDARLLFYGWVRGKYQLIVALQALEQARQHRADVKTSVDVGAASLADALRVDSQLAAAELLAERARNFADLLESQLRTQLHDPETQAYAIGEDLRAQLAPVPGVGGQGAGESAWR